MPKPKNSLIHEAQRKRGRLYSFTTKSILYAQILATIILPAIELGLENMLEVPVIAWATILPFHVLVAVFALVGYGETSKIIESTKLDSLEVEWNNLIDEYENQVRKSESLASGLVALAEQSVAVQGAVSILQSLLEHVDERSGSRNKASPNDVEKILAPLVQNRAEILRFINSEKYNFAIYLYNKKDGELHLFYRDCDNRIQRHDRSWRSGVGHVGLSFAQRRTIISPDVSEAEDIIGTESMVENDRQLYMSFLSTPIFNSVNHDGHPLGVLVITSDRRGHLTQEYKIVTETFAILLGIYFSNTLN